MNSIVSIIDNKKKSTNASKIIADSSKYIVNNSILRILIENEVNEILTLIPPPNPIIERNIPTEELLKCRLRISNSYRFYNI